MNAAVVHSFSAAPRYESFAEPVPSGEEVLVTVTAAGLAPDCEIACGRDALQQHE